MKKLLFLILFVNSNIICSDDASTSSAATSSSNTTLNQTELDFYNDTLLDAIEEENIPAVKFCINRGEDLDQEDDNVTPLLRALELLNLEIIELLLKNGAGVNYFIYDECTALDNYPNKAKLYAQLRKKGYNPNDPNQIPEIKKCLRNIVKLFIEYGAVSHINSNYSFKDTLIESTKVPFKETAEISPVELLLPKNYTKIIMDVIYDFNEDKRNSLKREMDITLNFYISSIAILKDSSIKQLEIDEKELWEDPVNNKFHKEHIEPDGDYDTDKRDIKTYFYCNQIYDMLKRTMSLKLRFARYVNNKIKTRSAKSKNLFNTINRIATGYTTSLLKNNSTATSSNAVSDEQYALNVLHFLSTRQAPKPLPNLLPIKRDEGEAELVDNQVKRVKH